MWRWALCSGFDSISRQNVFSTVASSDIDGRQPVEDTGPMIAPVAAGDVLSPLRPDVNPHFVQGIGGHGATQDRLVCVDLR